jgi:multidrug efflux system membrane fusion protein
VALVAAVIGVRALMVGGDDIATVKAETVPTLEKVLPSALPEGGGIQVAVRRSVAQRRPLFLSITGRVEAARVVTVKSQSSGTVTTAPAAEGSVVEDKGLLCGLDMEGRSARVRVAESELQQKQKAYDAVVELAANGWANEGRLATAKAALDATQAAVDLARSELAKTQMRAPFRGVFEKRLANVGDFLGPGGSCGVVVELDPARATLPRGASERDDRSGRARRGHAPVGALRRRAATSVSSDACGPRVGRARVEPANQEGALALRGW